MSNLSIRAFTPEDLPKIKELHCRYYSHLGFPDFLKLIVGFIIENEKGIVMAGGLELVAESVLVTNKSQTSFAIGKALMEAQKCMLYTARQFNIKELYAFVKDESDYVSHLKQHGFTDCFHALNMRVPNG
jgi:N-acetylglutamate synthase-like GNAT family acetyltransferase